MIQLLIRSESILSHFFWDSNLRSFVKDFQNRGNNCWEDVVSCKMQIIYQLGPGPDAITIFQEWGMSWWQLDTLFIYVGVWKAWCFGFGNVVFTGWLGNNMSGSGHELVTTGYLAHICWVLKGMMFQTWKCCFWRLTG